MNFFRKKTASFIAYEDMMRPSFTSKKYEALATEGYHKNVIVYRCVTLIARGIASIPWTLYERIGNDDHEVFDHPLLQLLNRPSAFVSSSALKESLISHLLLAGNAFLLIAQNELLSIRPDLVKISHDGAFKKFELENEKFIVDPITGFSKILHIKLYHPLQNSVGMSPLEAAASSIDQHNAVGSHNLSLLQNGGRPSGAFIFKGIRFNEEQRRTIRDDVRNAYEGAKNAGRILMLEGDVEWKDLGLSPKDMDFCEAKDSAARDIAQAFGVPPMLVGVKGDATYANYKEARYHLWEDTILPLFDFIVAELNSFLVSRFNGNLRLSYDMDKIPALSYKREILWNQMSNATFLTDSEKREALGYSAKK